MPLKNKEVFVEEDKVKEMEHLDYGRQHDLTIGEIRECEWFAHFPDEEAQRVVDTLKQLTEIAYHYYWRKRQPTSQRQHK